MFSALECGVLEGMESFRNEVGRSCTGLRVAAVEVGHLLWNKGMPMAVRFVSMEERLRVGVRGFGLA